MKDIRYTMILPGHKIPEHIQSCLAEQPSRAGLYNWIFAFKGEINTWNNVKDRLEDFDVVHLNMTPIDMPAIHEVREKLGWSSSTKLVLNNDYVCEQWDKWKIDPWKYDQVQRMGDMVFGTEPTQVSNMIEEAHCLPHPANTHVLKRLGVDKSEKEDSVGFINHWWDSKTYVPHRMLKKFQEKYKFKMKKIFGYSETGDLMNRWAGQMWEETVPLVKFPDYATKVQMEKVLFDPNSCHTYGRNGVEFACWNMPVVGSDRVDSYKKLFPDLIAPPFDHKANDKAFDIVFNKPEKVEEILKDAYEKVEYYNYENSKKRFLEALENSEVKKW